MKGSNQLIMNKCRQVAFTRISSLIASRQFASKMPKQTPDMLFHNYALSSSLVNKNLFESIANSGNTPLQGEIRIPLGLQQQHL